MNEIFTLKRNPTAVARMLAKMVVQDTPLAEVLDANNPFGQVIGLNAMTFSNISTAFDMTQRKLDVKLAVSPEDIYRHLSDRQRLEAHASPSAAEVLLRIPMDYVIAKSVVVEGTSLRKVQLPANTVFTLDGVDFSIYRPIDIIVSGKETLRAGWHVGEYVPVKEVPETDFELRTITAPSGTRYIELIIPVEQFSLKSTKVSASYNGLKKFIDFKDNFYYLRAYKSENGKWKEIAVSYSESSYDLSKTTVVATVMNQTLSVHVPSVYFESGSAMNIRLDVYTTKGDISMDLASLPTDKMKMEMTDLDDVEDGIYSKPLQNAKFALSGYSTTTGGKSSSTLEELKEVIVNSGDSGVTENEKANKVKSLGYELTKAYDNATDRRYVASRHINTPSNEFFGGISAGFEPVEFTFGTILDSDLNVKSSPSGITVLPGYYKVSGDRVIPLTDSELDFDSLNREQFLNRINSLDPLYSPFYNVIRDKGRYFTADCYHINPEVKFRTLKERDDTKPLFAAVQRIVFRKEGDEFVLGVQLSSNDAVKALEADDIVAHLSYIPEGATKRVGITGELRKDEFDNPVYVDDERIFYFKMTTSYEFTKDDKLTLTNVQAHSADLKEYAIPLTNKFDLTIGVVGQGNLKREIPIKYVEGLVPEDFTPLTNEQVTVTFGERLNYLESRTSTYLTDESYAKYDEDVPEVYTEPQYLEQDGVMVVTKNGDSLEYQLLHDVGEVKRDLDGNIVYKHRKGDYIYVNGKRVLEDIETVVRSFSILLVDGKFKFATDSNAEAALNELTRNIRDYAINDMHKVANVLPPRSEVQFSPKSTLGMVTVNVGGNVTQSVNKALSFNVEIYMDAAVFSDTSKQLEVKSIASSIIRESVKSNLISVDAIQKAIREARSDEIVSVVVHPLTEANQPVISLESNSQGFIVRSKLTELTDGELITQDDIDIRTLPFTK